MALVNIIMDDVFQVFCINLFNGIIMLCFPKLHECDYFYLIVFLWFWLSSHMWHFHLHDYIYVIICCVYLGWVSVFACFEFVYLGLVWFIILCFFKKQWHGIKYIYFCTLTCLCPVVLRTCAVKFRVQRVVFWL